MQSLVAEVLPKFLRFGLVGASGVLVDFGITLGVKEKLLWHKYVANSMGFVAAASSNYALNRLWTFASTDPNIAWEYSKFFGVALIGLAINNTLLWYFHERRTMNFYLAKGLAILLTTIWNFTANFFFTFVNT